MTKREFMEQSWISLYNRLPPQDADKLILCYNEQNGYMTTHPSDMAFTYAQIILEKQTSAKEDLSWDRIYTHWMPLFPPNGKPMFNSPKRLR